MEKDPHWYMGTTLPAASLSSPFFTLSIVAMNSACSCSLHLPSPWLSPGALKR